MSNILRAVYTHFINCPNNLERWVLLFFPRFSEEAKTEIKSFDQGHTLVTGFKASRELELATCHPSYVWRKEVKLRLKESFDFGWPKTPEVPDSRFTLMADTIEVWILNKVVEVSVPHPNFQACVLNLVFWDFGRIRISWFGHWIMKIWLSFNHLLPLYCAPKMLYWKCLRDGVQSKNTWGSSGTRICTLKELSHKNEILKIS